MFEDSLLYRHINSEAHRYRSTKLRAPTLVWHMGFLIDNRDDRSFDDTRTNLKAMIDESIVLLADRLRQHNVAIGAPGAGDRGVRVLPYVDDAILLFTHVYRDESDRFVIHDRPRRRHLDIVANDQRAVLIKFRWNDVAVVVRVQLQTEHFTLTVFADVQPAQVCAIDPNAGVAPPKCRLNAFDELSTAFWEEYKRFLFGLPDIRAMFEKEIFKHVFADFRGVVVSDETVDFPNSRFRSMRHEPDWATALVHELVPGLTHASRYECSASYLLDGRALLATAFGPQRPEYPDDERLPLTFALCVHQQSPTDVANDLVGDHQLGRLVDRVLLVMTLKLAALIDIALLRAASRRLAEIDNKTRGAREAVECYEESVEAFAKTREKIDAARHELDLVTTDFLRHKDNIYRAGLTYRIEASRYYVSLCATLVPALRIGRVQGFQPLDQFIDRRLGPTYDFIDRLGIRYERAANVMGRIDQAFTTIQSGHSGRAIVEIQKYGEIILLFFILPYYVVSTWKHLSEFGPFTAAIVGIVVYMLYVTGGLRVFFFRRDVSRRQRAHLAIRSVAVALVMMALALATLSRLAVWPTPAASPNTLNDSRVRDAP